MFVKPASLLVLGLLLGLAGCGKEPSSTLAPTSGSQNLRTASIDRLQGLSLQPDRGIAAFSAGKKTVTLPAGSVDGLAAALVSAGSGGVVIVKAGTHTESGMVTINQPVNLLGEAGATIVSTTAPLVAAGGQINPALYVRGTSGVTIWGLHLAPSGGLGGTAILLENAPGNLVFGNSIENYQYGVLVQQGDDSRILNNTVAVSTAWQTGSIPEGFGIVNINGDRTQIIGNDVSRGLFCIWVCDQGGVVSSNHVHDGFIGLIFCKVPQNSYTMPSGALVGADGTATYWNADKNVADNNANVGYLVIDSANHNNIGDNTASHNGAYDMELTTDTYRFGFLTPASHDNVVKLKPKNPMIVKNCGINNSITGGQLVDDTVDPCN